MSCLSPTHVQLGAPRSSSATCPSRSSNRACSRLTPHASPLCTVRSMSGNEPLARPRRPMSASRLSGTAMRWPPSSTISTTPPSVLRVGVARPSDPANVAAERDEPVVPGSPPPLGTVLPTPLGLRGNPQLPQNCLPCVARLPHWLHTSAASILGVDPAIGPESLTQWDLLSDCVTLVRGMPFVLP